MNREKLVEELRERIHMRWQCMEFKDYDSKMDELTDMIVNIIIARDAKNLEPLLKTYDFDFVGTSDNLIKGIEITQQAINETLTNFGVEIGGK